MRRWAVDPDRYSPDTRPADTYQLVYADDRSEIIAANLFHAEASEIAAAHNAEVSARPDVEGRCPAQAMTAMESEMADRDEVEDALWRTLARFDLEGYVDGVVDTLDTVIEWDDEGDEDDE